MGQGPGRAGRAGEKVRGPSSASDGVPAGAEISYIPLPTATLLLNFRAAEVRGIGSHCRRLARNAAEIRLFAPFPESETLSISGR